MMTAIVSILWLFVGYLILIFATHCADCPLLKKDEFTLGDFALILIALILWPLLIFVSILIMIEEGNGGPVLYKRKKKKEEDQ